MLQRLRSVISEYRLLLLVLAIGGFLRYRGIFHGISFHPDERHVIMSSFNMSWADLNPKTFAYGSLPFYMVFLVGKLTGNFHYDGMLQVGRVLSFFFGAIAPWLVYLLARTLKLSKPWSVFAATFLAFNWFHVQLSHFYAVDVILCTFLTAHLLFLFRAAETNKKKNWLLSALFMGLAISTKISALTFFGSFLFLLIQNWRDRRFSWLWFFGSVGLAFIVSFCTQPYVILDHTRFLHDFLEQNRIIVEGVEGIPFTVQFWKTPIYLYPLEQMARYTLGWPVFIVFVVSYLWGILRAIRVRNWVALGIFSVILFSYAHMGTFYAKYPRYFIPWYPLIGIVIAFFIQSLSDRWQKLIVPAVLGTTVVMSLAFQNIYSEDHVWFTASRWVYSNVPGGKKIIGEHWDDKLPMHLPAPGQNPGIYPHGSEPWELPLYESDRNPQKWNRVADLLNETDYIFLPTGRLYGSILRKPEGYPVSPSYFDALFSGRLGFDLVRSFQVDSEIGPFRFSHDLADESLTVYDHPKVLLFQKKRALTRDQIHAMITAKPDLDRVPSRETFLKAAHHQPITEVEPVKPTNGDGLWELLKWMLTLSFLGFFTFPILRRITPLPVESAWALSKPVGLLFVGLLVATPATLGLTKINGESIAFSVAVLFLIGFWTWDSKDFLEKLKAILRSEGVFWGLFVSFLLIRIFNPEIFWGEKPMNFSFLNFFIRTDSLPPTDPWASDQAMSYYYFGSFMLALIHRIGSIDSTFGYAFCIATNAAFFGSLIYGIFRMHGLGVRGGLVAAGVLLFAGNLEILRLIFIDGRAVNFDTFWASTRLFTSPNFSEYPLWSYVFGDVHAHNIHLPFTIATLMLLAASFTEPLYSKRVGLWALTGTLLGSFVISNTWDVVTYFFVVLCFFLASNHPLKRRLASVVVMGIFAAVLYAPYLFSFLGGNQQAHGGLADSAFNTVPQLFFFFGYPAIFGLLVYPWSEVRWKAWFKYPVLVLPLGLSFLIYREYDTEFVHIGFSIISGVLIWLALQSQDRLQRAAYLSCGVILFLTEHFTFMDRMNTIFKGYLPMGILLWVGVWSRSLRGPKWIRFAALAPLFMALVSGGVTIAGILRDSKTPGPRPTLYGDDYLWVTNDNEARLIQWIRTHIKGTPAVLEAFGNYYGPFTRITMHTGLPSYLGWEHHTVQRGVYHPLVIKRRDQIPVFYNTLDPEQALSILAENRVDYFVVSRLERENYKNEGGLEKFAAHPELFIPMAQFGDATLYTTFVSRRDFNPNPTRFESTQ